MFCCSSRWQTLSNPDDTQRVVELTIQDACRETKKFDQCEVMFLSKPLQSQVRTFSLIFNPTIDANSLLFLKLAYPDPHSHTKAEDIGIRIVRDETGSDCTLVGNVPLSQLVFFNGAYTVTKAIQDTSTHSLSFELQTQETCALKFITKDSKNQLSAGQELIRFTIIPKK